MKPMVRKGAKGGITPAAADKAEPAVKAPADAGESELDIMVED